MIEVTDDFLEIWKYLSVKDLKMEINKLCEKEKVLLGLLVCDKYKDPNDILCKNLEHIEYIMDLIEDFFSSNIKTEDYRDIIKELQEKTGSDYINTNRLVDKRGFSIPDPPNEEEITRLSRDSKIKSIFKNT